MRPEYILLKVDFKVSWVDLTKASLAMWASSCNWINLLSSLSLALSASSRNCFSLCRRCLSTWTTDIWSMFRGDDLLDDEAISIHSEWWQTFVFLFTTCFLALSSLAWAFICWTSSESTRRRRINRSWFPMHSWRICSRKKRKPIMSGVMITND